jgi:nucleotide-binding universal stress UspA family protein
MIRKIIVPVRNDGKGNNVLAHAAVLARGHGAHIAVTHCRPRPEDLLPFGIPLPDFLKKQIVDQSSQLSDLEESGLREELSALAAKFGLVESDTPIKGTATVAFTEVTGRQVDVIKRHGRLVDLIAVAQPDRDRNIGTNTLQAALFSSGRPVLMCPPRKTAPETLGQHVVLAWNGSAEAVRALSQSMSVIAAASTVTILTNGTDAGPGTTVDEVVEYLAAHGKSAQVAKMDATRSIGAALLAETTRIGGDMLIMGAYGDSHERETLFGGNTQTVVDQSGLPVLFSH